MLTNPRSDLIDFQTTWSCLFPNDDQVPVKIYLGTANNHTAHRSRLSQRYFKGAHNHITPGVIERSSRLVTSL